MKALVLTLLLVTPALAEEPAAAKRPYSCQMYDEAAKKCAANTIGSCYVQHEVDRLLQQCLRDGGRP
jgi:hypothetical protein